MGSQSGVRGPIGPPGIVPGGPKQAKGNSQGIFSL